MVWVGAKPRKSWAGPGGIVRDSPFGFSNSASYSSPWMRDCSWMRAVPKIWYLWWLMFCFGIAGVVPCKKGIESLAFELPPENCRSNLFLKHGSSGSDSLFVQLVGVSPKSSSETMMQNTHGFHAWHAYIERNVFDMVHLFDGLTATFSSHLSFFSFVIFTFFPFVRGHKLSAAARQPPSKQTNVYTL